MRKLSLLLGTLGGAMAGYLFSNKKLRDELVKTKDAEAAAKLLGKHLQKDGKKLAGQVQDFIHSEEVQKNITKAKTYATQKANEAGQQISKAVSSGGKRAKSAARKGVKKAKAAATKAVKKAGNKMKVSTRRIATKTRKLS